MTESLPHARIKDWGVKEWIWPGAPLLKVVMDGVSDTIDYQVEQLLDPDDYFRFQPKLDQADEDLDDASAENLRALKLQATRLLEERDERLKLERLVPRLMD